MADFRPSAGYDPAGFRPSAGYDPVAGSGLAAGDVYKRQVFTVRMRWIF